MKINRYNIFMTTDNSYWCFNGEFGYWSSFKHPAAKFKRVRFSFFDGLMKITVMYLFGVRNIQLKKCEEEIN